MAKIKLYGIPNCDAVKKTLAFLKALDTSVEFHDFKKYGISKEKLKEWVAVHTINLLLNKKSTAWRLLSQNEQQQAESEHGALQLMQEYPNLIKRPVVEISGTVLLGFDETAYRAALNM